MSDHESDLDRYEHCYDREDRDDGDGYNDDGREDEVEQSYTEAIHVAGVAR